MTSEKELQAVRKSFKEQMLLEGIVLVAQIPGQELQPERSRSGPRYSVVSL